MGGFKTLAGELVAQSGPAEVHPTEPSKAIGAKV
jgi:hypothetical protein